MRRSFVFLLLLGVSSLAAQMAMGQNVPAQPQPVPYATANQINTLMAQLESTAVSTTADLSRMRINKWKGPSDNKRQAESNRQSILRNLEAALPGMIAAVRSNPDDVAASFKLYRNLDALYDVLSSVTESAGAFGSRDDYQALANDLNSLEQIRRDLADRVQTLASSKETELTRLRNEVRAAQAAASAAPPKKVIIDDTQPAKKRVYRKKHIVRHSTKKTNGQAEKEKEKKTTPPQPQ